MVIMKNNYEKTFWDLKPFWCQPWSIISFGVLILICSWKFFNNIIITSVLGLFIIAWWVVFLILAPSSYNEISNKE